MKDRGKATHQWLQGLLGHLWNYISMESDVNSKWYADSSPSASLLSGSHTIVNQVIALTLSILSFKVCE